MRWAILHIHERAVVDAAYAAGVGIDGVRPYRITHGGAGGLIFGFATVNEPAIAEGVDILARVVGRL
jgi:GntR family transcriptional regulator/MocR family aminotransferase